MDVKDFSLLYDQSFAMNATKFQARVTGTESELWNRRFRLHQVGHSPLFIGRLLDLLLQSMERYFYFGKGNARHHYTILHAKISLYASTIALCEK